MMEDIAMHILEILMNSIKADSTKIILKIRDSFEDDIISFQIEDDGKGMDEDMVKRAADPFTTSRTTRRIGMGLAFMKGLAEMCGGSFNIESTVGKGTIVTASVQKLNIDTPELGDLGEMMMEAVQSDENIDYVLEYTTDYGQFVFDSGVVKKELDGVSLLEPEILLWIKEYINQGIEQAKEDTQL